MTGAARRVLVGRVVAVTSALLAAMAPGSSRAQSAPSPTDQTRAAPQMTRAPSLVTFVPAVFPASERRSAVVGLAITIAADGRVRAVEVLDSAGEAFDEAAKAAARQFVFEPAEVDGHPAAVKIRYAYTFTYEAPRPTRLEGAVRDAATGAAIAGARVALDGAPPVTTDAEGRFAIDDAPEGARALTLAAPGFDEVRLTETLAPHASTRLDLGLERAKPKTPAADEPVEVTVRGRTRARETASVTVDATEARKVAGTQGDTLKVLQNLPGVARPAFGSGQLVVWGSAPKDTRVYVDGVEIPQLFHGSAIRSTVNADLVKSVTLVPGGYGAEYGRSLGGLVRAETRALPAEGVHGYASADTLDASAMATAAIGDRVRVGLAGRYGYLDRELQAVSAPDVTDVYPIPRYRDAQAKVSVALRPGESIDAVALASVDDLTRAVPSSDPARVRRETTHADYQRVYMHYARDLSDGARVDVTPFVGHDTSRFDARFGGNPATLDVGTWRYGLRASHESRPWRAVALRAGVDVLGSRADVTRSGSLTLPSREGDATVFGQPPGDDYNADAWSTSIVNAAPFVTAEVGLGPLTVTPGVRLDAFLIEGSRRVPAVGQAPPIGYSRLEGALEPRLAVRWEATPRLALLASYGQYRQAPEPEDLSAVFGTPELGLSRATHYAAGEAVSVTKTLRLETIAFYKQMQDLVVRTTLTTPKLARALVQDGVGRSYGLQLLLRQDPWHGFFGWVALTLSRSERRYVSEDAYRPFDYDQPVVLTAVASKELGPWTFGARFRYATGLPRTPVAYAFYDVRDDAYQPIFGPLNGIRLPDFYQLDVRVDRSFRLGAAKLALYVEAQNVTFHTNEEELVYSSDYRRRGAITGLPALAIVGARVDL